MSNLKLAVRRLAKTPFVTAIAILSLGLGIGANAAIFSLFNQTLLQALPVAAPGELVNLTAPEPKPGSTSCGQAGDCDAVFSYPMFRDLQAGQTVFSGMAAHVGFGANLTYRGHTMSADGLLVSGSYFPVLGLQPALGRLLGPHDDTRVDGEAVAVLSHGYWTSRLGGDASVLNQPLTVNGQTLTIVGVAPMGFRSTTLGLDPEIFVPITMRGLLQPGSGSAFENRRAYWAYVFARRKPGVTIDQARAGVNAVYRPIITDVEAPLQTGMSEQTMARFTSKEVGVEEGRRGQSQVHGEARIPMIFLMAVTGIVLLIACANIANLLLARSAGRATEMAVRLSIGASRRQLLAQLLTESFVLALLGGAAGLVFAHWTLAAMASLLPAEVVETLGFGLDGGVVAFSMALAIVTGFMFGLLPALHSTRPDLASTMKAQAGQPAGARGAAWFRHGLVTAQIALSMALLVSAGLFVKSLMNVSRIDLGVEVDQVVTFRISPGMSGYEPARAFTLYERAEQDLAALPGVTGVGMSMVPLLAGSNWGSDVSVQGFERGPDTDAGARYNRVSAGYFRTLGIPLTSGREFTGADATGAPRVAIVNEAFTRKFNLGRDAVGKRMAQGGGTDLDIEIVGVVQDAKYSEVKQEIPPLFFLPYAQAERMGSLSFYLRAALPPEQMIGTVQSAMSRLDPHLPLEDLKTMPQQVRDNIFLDRMISTLSASFAVLATILAAIGLYGVLAYTVAQRTREFGLRMALGADAGRVRRLVLSQIGIMTIVGGAVGAVSAWTLGYYARTLLFEMTAWDASVFGSAAVLLTLVAFAAGYVPAYRASRVDPMIALRYE
jgi:predicted permease